MTHQSKTHKPSGADLQPRDSQKSPAPGHFDAPNRPKSTMSPFAIQMARPATAASEDRTTTIALEAAFLGVS